MAATATMTPCSTPRPIAPTMPITANRNSALLVRHSLAKAPTSISEIAAEASTAPSAALGTWLSGPLRKATASISDSAATTAASWLLPPIDRFTAVREIRSGHGQAAEQAGGDVGRAEADQLAIGVDPLAGPCGEAPGGDDARAEADEEHGTCAEQQLVERQITRGRLKAGSADGTWPMTATPCAGKSSSIDKAVPRTMATSGPGRAGQRAASSRSMTNRPAANARLDQLIEVQRRRSQRAGRPARRSRA